MFTTAQLFVIWSLLADHCPNQALVQKAHDAWQAARAEEKTTQLAAASVSELCPTVFQPEQPHTGTEKP